MATERKKLKTAPNWAVRRATFNLSAFHSDMLDEIVVELKKGNRRENMTTAIERMIAHYYQFLFKK